MKDIIKIIALRIREERIKQDFSQEKLAELAETHRNYIGEIERAEKIPTILTLYKICLALNITLSDLLNGV